MATTFNTVRYACEHCGRTWVAETQRTKGNAGGWTGFLVSNVNTHKLNCAKRTPKERVRRALRDAKRWEERPPLRTQITDNFNHKGMKV